MPEMKLELNHSAAQWLQYQVMPIMLEMCQVRCNLYCKDDPEYWTYKIVHSCLEEIETKLMLRMIQCAKKKFVSVTLNVPESVTLYRYLFNFPIPEQEVWKDSQRQFIIHQIYQAI